MTPHERRRAVALVPLPAYERCLAALAACRTVDEAREISDRATAMRACRRPPLSCPKSTRPAPVSLSSLAHHDASRCRGQTGVRSSSMFHPGIARSRRAGAPDRHANCHRGAGHYARRYWCNTRICRQDYQMPSMTGRDRRRTRPRRCIEL
jgi:hypothetical protein